MLYKCKDCLCDWLNRLQNSQMSVSVQLSMNHYHQMPKALLATASRQRMYTKRHNKHALCCMRCEVLMQQLSIEHYVLRCSAYCPMQAIQIAAVHQCTQFRIGCFLHISACSDDGPERPATCQMLEAEQRRGAFKKPLLVSVLASWKLRF